MGFTELMSSGRGPGVIGTLIALVVLGGFGLLSMFVFDEGLQGGGKKIEAVIRDQALLIESNKSAVEDYRERIAKLDNLKSVGKQADEMKLKVASLTAKIAELAAAKDEATAAVAAATADWEKYKDEYRASEWAAAVGEDLGDLTSLTGRVYSQVKIRKVDHTGMQITDATGPKTISSEDLPLELQDRFQFDDEKTAAALIARGQGENIHSSNVEIAALATNIDAKERRIGELQKQVVALTNEISTAQSNISGHSVEISNMQSRIAAERSKKISNAPQLEAQLAQMRKAAEKSRASIPTNQAKLREMNAEIETLTREVAGLNADIEKIKKELKAKVPTEPKP
jgi:peptidoglycan hydrolase CwlO-like protein